MTSLYFCPLQDKGLFHECFFFSLSLFLFFTSLYNSFHPWSPFVPLSCLCGIFSGLIWWHFPGKRVRIPKMLFYGDCRRSGTTPGDLTRNDVWTMLAKCMLLCRSCHRRGIWRTEVHNYFSSMLLGVVSGIYSEAQELSYRFIYLILFLRFIVFFFCLFGIRN